MIAVLGSALVSPLVLVAAALAAAFTLTGNGSNSCVIFFLVLIAPLCASVGSQAVYRWCFPDSSRGCVSLLTGIAVMAVLLHSAALLDALAHLAKSEAYLPVDVAFSAFVELSIATVLTVSAVMLAVLSVELPLRMLLSSVSSYEPGVVLMVVRFGISVWLLCAGANLISDAFGERFTRIVSSLVS